MMFRPPWAWREFIDQTWFVARVSVAPTIFMAIPFVVLGTYTLNTLLVEIGAADLSGTGVALGAVTQGGPIVTVLVISGAAARVPGFIDLVLEALLASRIRLKINIARGATFDPYSAARGLLIQGASHARKTPSRQPRVA